MSQVLHKWDLENIAFKIIAMHFGRWGLLLCQINCIFVSLVGIHPFVKTPVQSHITLRKPEIRYSLLFCHEAASKHSKTVSLFQSILGTNGFPLKELNLILNTRALYSLKVYYSKTKKITLRQVLLFVFLCWQVSLHTKMKKMKIYKMLFVTLLKEFLNRNIFSKISCSHCSACSTSHFFCPV